VILETAKGKCKAWWAKDTREQQKAALFPGSLDTAKVLFRLWPSARTLFMKKNNALMEVVFSARIEA
jgi:hypothetical protein